MAEASPAILAFNRGLLSPLAQARADLKRHAMSAEVQTNFMPRVLGSAMFRPGTEYIGGIRGNLPEKMLPFVFSTTDVALLEATNATLRVWLPEASGEPDTVLYRVAVASTITNGTFFGSLTGWTNADQAGAVSSWNAGDVMALIGTGFNAAIEYQQVTVAAGDIGKEHALRIVVPIVGTRVVLNVGTSAGDGTYAMNLTLEEGNHSIAFTPAGNFFVQFSNALQMPTYISLVAIEAAGAVEITAPWTTPMLPLLRHDQSGDVVYIAADGMRQVKVQRWGQAGFTGSRSFSVVFYAPLDGPFLLENTGPTTITPSGVAGAITLTASLPLFQQGHVGALFRLASVGQFASVDAAGPNQWSGAIQATGLVSGTSRDIGIQVAGTFVGTVVLQRSVGAIGAWEDVPGETFNAPTVPGTGYSDGLDNQIIFYRIGIGAAYTSGTANCLIGIALNGSITGIVRVTAVTNSLSASAFVQTLPGDTGVLHGLGNTDATDAWWEGMWSNVQGFPTSVVLDNDGRLVWFGRNRIAGSVVDAYESYDDTVVGDSGPIIRTIGSGPVDVINWALALDRLVFGAQAAEKSCAPSSLTGPLTPTDFNMKNAGTQGSAAMAAVKVDHNGIFVQRSGCRVYQMSYKPNYFGQDYSEDDLTNFVPDLAVAELGIPLSVPGIAGIVAQRQPDTRIHAWFNDGTVRVLVYDPTEDEHAWIKVETPGAGGLVVDAVVLPGQGGASAGAAEDLVYYVVKRTIGGSTVRRLERWAHEAECWGGTVTKCADCGVSFSYTVPTLFLLAVAPHLVGQEVVVWADGVDQGGPFLVDSGGTVTLPAGAGADGTGVMQGYLGLAYEARFKSTKLAYAAQMGSPLTQKKRIARVGVVLANAHAQGLQYGRSFDNMLDLPLTYKGAPVSADFVYAAYDDEGQPLNGDWDTDSRLCLRAASPRPVTLLAAVMTMETRERP